MTKSKKFLILFITELVCVGIAVGISVLFFKTNEITLDKTKEEVIKLYLCWIPFWTVFLTLLANVIFSHKVMAEGKVQEVIFYLSTAILISIVLTFVGYSLFSSGFAFASIDWVNILRDIVEFRKLAFYGIALLVFIGFTALYLFVIDRRILAFTKSGLRGTGKLKQVGSNLENSRWMNEQEKKKLFKSYDYSQLKDVTKDGIPIGAKLDSSKKKMSVMFNSPCHAIVIGSTGSGKTTTFVTPMIQILGATNAGSSMIVTDPKGELFSMHSKFLLERGYDVKVIDLRDTYSSYRWNPLDGIWTNYQKYLFAHTEAFLRSVPVGETQLILADDKASFEGVSKWYEFNGYAYSDYKHLVDAIKIFKRKMYDEVYEDLNDLVSILIPVDNPKDPMWEKGARSIVLATLLAMLEDSADSKLGMTKEKFNFFNMAKILQNSNNDYLELKNYFAGRSVLSKALSLSKQVCDCAESTRASYMSIVYEKLTLFNDAGICALTSSSDFDSEQLAYKPTALFLKIPDEKDTRHNLASIFILNIYKTLIKVASSREDLSLPRNVFFIMDEFGNMPKIEKFDKFITVGRSRKIWFVMIIQSYAQLNNVYGDTVADIVKGNCGIKMFIGSNDMGTCKEYSELCGNITVVTTSTSGSSNSKDVSISSSTQVRPLIYPSDLQRLNKPGDIGHSIIVTFGNYPLNTYFTPSFNVPLYKFGKMNTSDTERLFDENAILYSAATRNKLISGGNEETDGGEDKASADNNNSTGGGKAIGKIEVEKKVVSNTATQTQTETQSADNGGGESDPQSELIRLWQVAKQKNSNLTIDAFFRQMAKQSEVE